MTALRKLAEPPRPAALRRYPDAFWDGNCWRDGSFWYDEHRANKAVGFFRDHLVFSEGEWAGQPFILEEFQEQDIVRPLFGWKRPDGTRRYRRAFVWIARKNGKTELAAGIALLVLLGDAEPGGQVFSIASEKDQAALVFNKASNMVARAPRLYAQPPQGAGLVCLKESIYCSALNASFRPLSGKPKGKHGLAMSGLVGDEIHEWPSGDLYTFVHDSAAARRQPLEFLISTAGQKGTHGEEVFKECQSILAGDVDDPETMVLIYAPAEGDDWTKEETWRKANPNFGKSVKTEPFLAAFRLARQLPRLENDFKRYRLNVWTDQAVKWLPIDAIDDEGKRFGWDHCVGDLPWKDEGKSSVESQFERRLEGQTCFGGLDLSSTNDLSGLVWWFPIQDGLDRPVALVRAFKPADLIKVHAKRDRIPYDRMVAEGSLFTTPGNVVDYAFIQEQIKRDAERFRVAYVGDVNRKEGQGGLAIDRWNATETAVKLQQEGLPVVLFGQGFASMSGPAKELERLVMGNAFDHGGHPLFRRHAQAVAVEMDSADNIKPAKDQSAIRIDLIVGAIMAIGIASKGEEVDVGSLLNKAILERAGFA